MAGDAVAMPLKPWTTREVQILREHYPTGGAGACLALLPGRSEGAIYARASLEHLRHVAVRRGQPKGPRRSSDTFTDEAIRAVYQSHPEKGAVAALAARIGRRRHWINRRAMQLGLVVPRFKEPAWSEAEIELLATHAHRSAEVIQRIFRDHGHRRTEAAIHVKRTRLECCDTHDPDHFTASSIARLLGVDRKTVTRYIHLGQLRATRRGTKRAERQGGDHHWVHWKDLRTFIRDNAHAVDLRKVDRVAFIELLVRD